MNYPTIKQLRYFIALEEHGHFARAAESCFVSQSAFSVAIRELESVLNIQLADRDNKNVTITPVGKEIAVHARLVLRDLEGLMDIAVSCQPPLTGKLKIGVIPTIAPFLIPRILPGLKKSFPRLDLFLYEDITQRVYQQLMDGDLDLIIIALPYELKKVEYMRLFRDKFYFASKRNSRLLKGKSFSIEQLPGESVLLMEDGHCLRDHALSACKIRNLDKVSQMTASSLLTLIQMVDADLGVTFLPEMVCNSAMIKSFRLDIKPMSAGSYRDIGLVWRKGSARKREFNLLGEYICEQLK